MFDEFHENVYDLLTKYEIMNDFGTANDIANFTNTSTLSYTTIKETRYIKKSMMGDMKRTIWVRS
jgi:hypothetical protein